MDEIVKGIVIKTKDYKENDKLLSLLTFEKGKLLTKARGVKKATSKLKSFCQPFCFADFEITQSKGGSILTGARAIDSFFTLATDYDKFTYASFVLFLADKICQEGQVYSEFFINLIKTLSLLDKSSISPKMIVSKLMLDILSSEGFEFNFENCSCGKVFEDRIFLNLDSGEIVCSDCKDFNFIEINKGVLSSIKLIFSNNYDKLNTIKLSSNLVDKMFVVLKKDVEARFEINLSSFKF